MVFTSMIGLRPNQIVFHTVLEGKGNTRSRSDLAGLRVWLSFPV